MDFFHANFSAVTSKPKKKRKSTATAFGKFQYDAREGSNPQKHPDELLHTETGNMPAAFPTPQEFFFACDELERKNGVRARTLRVALPLELGSKDQKIELSRAIAETIAVAASDDPGKPLPWHIAIHDSPTNPHVHLMFSERMYDATKEDFYGEKPKNFFSRENPKTNCFRQNRAKNLTRLRERVADTINSHLSRAGYGEEHHVSHLSYEDQGIDKVPGVHVGYSGHAMAAGRTPERVKQIAEKGDSLGLLGILEGAKSQVSHHEKAVFTNLKNSAQIRLNQMPSYKTERDFLYSQTSYKAAAQKNKDSYKRLVKANQELAELKSDSPALANRLGDWLVSRAFNLAAGLVGSDQRMITRVEALEAAKQAALSAYHEQQAAKTSLAATKAAIERRAGRSAAEIVSENKAARLSLTESVKAYGEAAKGKLNNIQKWYKFAKETHSINTSQLADGNKFVVLEPDAGAFLTTSHTRKNLGRELEKLGFTLDSENRVKKNGRAVANFDDESRRIELQTKAYDEEFLSALEELQIVGTGWERDQGRAYKAAKTIELELKGSAEAAEFIRSVDRNTSKRSAQPSNTLSV